MQNTPSINRLEVSSANTDLLLFSRIAGGDGHAYTALFNDYAQLVKRNAIKLLKSEFWAEEIVQEVFLQLWAGREKLTEVESPSAYIFRITANRCLDRIRRQRLEIKAQYLLRIGTSEASPSHLSSHYDWQQVHGFITEAVEKLTPQQRQVFVLQRDEGLSYQQIAERLGISKNTVRNHMVKALETIRSYLRTKGELFVLLFSAWWMI